MWNYFFIVRNSFNLKNEAAQHELNSIKNERRNIISLILKMKEGEVGHVFIVIYRFDCIEVDNIVTESKDSNWISLGSRDLPQMA